MVYKPSKLIDSDFIPIPHTDPNWLPKSIKKDFRGITANARQATRLGCELREPSKFDSSQFIVFCCLLLHHLRGVLSCL